MAILYVTEGRQLGRDQRGRTVQAVQEPVIQTRRIDLLSPQALVLHHDTRAVEFYAQADCYVKFSVARAPEVAAVTDKPIRAGTTTISMVPPGLAVAAIDGVGIVTGGGNLVSANGVNSRAAATLAAGATFQGTGEDVSNYGRAGIAIHSTNSTDGVLTIEVSHDDSTYFGPTRDWADTSIATPHMWNIVERYFRIKYVNGTTEATALSIQVHYSTNADIILGHQLGETLPAETEAVVTRPATSFDLDTARIHIKGQRSFFFFGFNGAVGTAWEDIHPTGGDINWQTAAQAIEVVSTDAADNGTTPGLGVQSVEVHGLSDTGVDQDEVILTDGTSSVAGVLTYRRVNKMHSETCGTYGGSHQGNITCQVEGGGAVLSRMTGEEGSVDTAVVYGSGEAGNGYWSVPLGKVMYITRLEVIPNVSANKNVDVILYEREDLLDVTTPFAPRREVWGESGIEEPLSKEFKSHIKIKPLTDIWFRAKASATSKIKVSLDFYLADVDADGA